MELTATYDLSFPDDSGFDKTSIRFYGGKPDLVQLFFADGKPGPMRLFVTDSTVASLADMAPFISRFSKDEDGLHSANGGNDILLVLAPGEANKDMNHVLSIVSAALSRNFDRSSVFIGIGGGVITDMTGFAASMFKRGVPCEFVPTTLLCMVDAAVGGKTGCDFDGYKNMIGSFHPAQALHVFPSFIGTLPEDEWRSGLSEAIKTAFLFSKPMTELFRAKPGLIAARDPETMHTVITECVKAKAAVVHEDLREKGSRAFLNLGHTFGHALESIAGLGKTTHGEAVAWGMGRAADLSVSLGIAQADFAEQTKALLSSYGYDMSPLPRVLEEQGLGKEKAAELILSAMRKDKKNKAKGALRAILQSGECRTLIQDVSEAQVMKVLV